MAAAATLVVAAGAAAFQAPALQAGRSRRPTSRCKAKLKGPYGDSYCLCPDGQKRPVQVDNRVTSPCGPAAVYCAAYRAPWAEALGRQRMWIANIFARDLDQWDTFPDHHDLVRGYILEKYFTETNPTHKLAEMRSYGGLGGAEYEAPAAARFFERYLSAKDFDDAHHYLLAYELQRRYYVRDDQGQIQKVRALAIRIQQADSKFKPLRDATHNQITATLIPRLEAYRDTKPAGAIRSQVDELIVEIQKLTRLDDSALRAQLPTLDDAKLRAELTAAMPGAQADPVDALEALASIMVRARQAVASRKTSPADDRRLVDAAITATALLQKHGAEWLAVKGESARRSVRVLGALAQAAYGTGAPRRARGAPRAARSIEESPEARRSRGADLAAGMKRIERVVDWAQQSESVAFTAGVGAVDLPPARRERHRRRRAAELAAARVRAGRVARRGFASGQAAVRHDLFGSAVDTGVRALNPGLAMGRLRVAPPEDGYERDEIVALPETPADLEPAAGILTQGEGNVLSHVQLLARALGIPNVVLTPAAYRKIAPHDGKQVSLIATPRGRVLIDEASAMSPEERFRSIPNTRATTSGSPTAARRGERGSSTSTARASTSRPRRRATWRPCGARTPAGRAVPGAFLGELKHLFPDHVVARGVVVLFARARHTYHAPVAVPDRCAAATSRRQASR
jgi:hypothetical protein